MRRVGLRRRRTMAMPEIGLTPLIDTALTLLIVFMVTTPMLENAIKVELPRGSIKEGGNEQQELVISIDKKGTLFFNNRPIVLEKLGNAVREVVSHQPKNNEKSVWLRVHGDTTTVSTLSAVINEVKLIGGVKDVKIRTQDAVAHQKNSTCA